MLALEFTICLPFVYRFSCFSEMSFGAVESRNSSLLSLKLWRTGAQGGTSDAQDRRLTEGNEENEEPITELAAGAGPGGSQPD